MINLQKYNQSVSVATDQNQLWAKMKLDEI